MKKLFKTLLAGILAATSLFAFASCGDANTIYVDTNAFFAPFEYYDGTEIKGVDVDIMNKVGERLGKKVKFENTDFDVIIDNVASGKKYDCGAAGITVTPARAEKVDFSDPYYTSIQYVIYKATDTSVMVNTATNGTSCVYWSDLMGKKIGVQRDTTGHIYADIEINGDGPDYPGELAGTTGTLTPYDNAQLAVDAIGANQIDVVIVDELPAQYICNANSAYVCKALYYDADTATEEQYAICVTKGNTELLNAINEVLAELGESGINALVSQHLGLGE
ncbi:MAG: transporter substrate-binding domain-containing protein [Clostridia bacterium]|nr:transporter substrate-binding domain-containing protein [Clostridia bacterium]